MLRAAWCFLRYSARAGTGKHAAKLTGDRHSRGRTQRAISYHYDLPVDFWRLWLDSQLVYSCAYFEEANATLEEAQVAKLDLICRKLRRHPGERLLDMGCGWGVLIGHAAKHYGVKALEVTPSTRQARASCSLCPISLSDWGQLSPAGMAAIATKDGRASPAKTFRR